MREERIQDVTDTGVVYFAQVVYGTIFHMTSKLYIVKDDTLVQRFYHISHLHIAQ